MQRLLVIIVTYNGMQWIDRCVSGVLQSSAPADIFLWDNHSADGTAAHVREALPSVHLVESPENLGFAAGNNAGFRYALEQGYDAVYLLNQDAWVLPDTLAHLLRQASAHPDFGILSPLQMRADGISYNKAFARDVLPLARPAGDDLLEVPFVMAAHWLVTRACLEKVGLFASLFPHFGNDDNYCHRVLYHGFRIGYVPSVKGIHDHWEGQRTVEQLVRQNYTFASLVRLCNPLKTLIGGLLWTLPYTLVKTLRYRSFLPLKEYPKVLSQLGKVRQTRRLTCREGVREV